MRLKITMGVLLLAIWPGCAWAKEDPAVEAAIAACPGAAAFVRVHGLPHAEASAPASEPSDPALRAQLLEMARIDQAARDGGWSPAALQHMNEVDAAHLPRIRSIVGAHGGLPNADAVGADGVNAAWLLVQHADSDPALQERVLASIAPLRESGQVSGQEVALLTDRVLVNQGRPQRYGSQLVPVGGSWVPKPMEAPDQVDARRAAIGEMPLVDYICVASRLMPPPPAP